MTVRVSANTKRVGRGGFGTLGSLIPTESFFFDDVDDVNAIWRAEITRFPAGRLFAFNNGTFTYEGADSSFDYTVYKNGAAFGSYTVTLGEPSGGETASGGGITLLTAVSFGQGYATAQGYGQSAIIAISYGEGLSPNLIPQGGGQTTLTAVSGGQGYASASGYGNSNLSSTSYGQGYALSSGSGSTAVLAVSYGQGPMVDRQPDVVIYVNLHTYVVHTEINTVVING